MGYNVTYLIGRVIYKNGPCLFLNFSRTQRCQKPLIAVRSFEKIKRLKIPFVGIFTATKKLLSALVRRQLMKKNRNIPEFWDCGRVLSFPTWASRNPTSWNSKLIARLSVTNSTGFLGIAKRYCQLLFSSWWRSQMRKRNQLSFA